MPAYYWFDGDSLAQLKSELAAGATDRVEVHVENEHCTLVVKPTGASANAAINDSHRCPPDCP